MGTVVSSVLQLKNVHKAFDDVPALAGIDAVLADNAYITLLGPSGSGKTTLLRIIAGFEQPDAGEIFFAGRSMAGVPPHARGIGFVFQNFALFPHLSVAQNVAFGLQNRAVEPITDPKAVAARVRDLISLVGLSGLEDRAITQISGGQKQRVALARTLVTEPSMVLLDEPLGALDANLRMRMRDELRTIRERCGVTFLHVTGSETEALAMGDTILVLAHGRIVQSSDAGTVYNRPASAEVARFLNCYNIFTGEIAGDDFATSVGKLGLGGVRQPSGAPAYVIRHDRVSIRPDDAEIADDEVRIEGWFVASEYSGSAINSFFTLADGRIFEVETHLSHAAPEVYEERSRYSLVWKREDAIGFV
jgi:ABC-type Fe3+/spermidine/putrescine transport system ATPase subunit